MAAWPEVCWAGRACAAEQHGLPAGQCRPWQSTAGQRVCRGHHHLLIVSWCRGHHRCRQMCPAVAAVGRLVLLLPLRACSRCSNEAANPQKYVAAVMSSLYQQVLDNLLYLGIWGNSNYTNIEQWVQVRPALCLSRPLPLPVYAAVWPGGAGAGSACRLSLCATALYCYCLR